jgi:neutral ceramidase
MNMSVRLLLVCAGLLFEAAAVPGQEFRAGAAKVEITPPIGFAMWGYGARHEAPSVGVLDPLHARALVLAAGSERIALVSLDLGRAPTRPTTAAIRARVKAAAGIEHIFLVATHTHHGPVLELDTWPSPKDPYLRYLEEKIAEVILTAAQTLRPAKLGIAAKEITRNRNRHSKRPDKPVDRELLVLRVEGHDGQPIALAVNYAAHPTLHDAKVRKFSADYPGVLADLVEKETGARCLFLQGAAGDLSTDPGEERGPEKFGQALGREVLALAQTIRCTTLEKPTLQIREDDFRFGRRFDLGNPVLKAGFVAAFFRELVDFYEREYRDGVRPHLTTALLDGRIGFVGVSGEFFCGHALSLKRRARLEHLFFLGYCNDYQQYFPTIEAAAEGGYGADPAVSPAEVGAGERMMNQALIHLYKMRGRLPNLPPDP